MGFEGNYVALTPVAMSSPHLLTISKPCDRLLSFLGGPSEKEISVTQRPPEEKSLPTIWHVPDELWEKIEPILQEHDPPKRTGRPRADRRDVLDALIFRLRTGCQWNRMPKEFPDDSTVHRAFQRWVEFGVLDRIWAALVEECEELGGVDWEWQAADGAMGKARFGGTSSVLTLPTAEKTG